MYQPKNSFYVPSATSINDSRSGKRQSGSCGFLLVRGQPIDSFLLMRTENGFDLPKGHLESSESEFDCALRELREETGIAADDIVVDPEFHFRVQYNTSKDKRDQVEAHRTVVIFLARLTRDVEIKTTEHVGFSWMTWIPPHRFHQRTIDLALAKLSHHLQTRSVRGTWCSPAAWPLLEQGVTVDFM